jgi:hypothetical protein
MLLLQGIRTLKTTVSKSNSLYNSPHEMQSHGSTPKGLSLSNSVISQLSSEIVERVSKAFPKDRIHFHWHNNVSRKHNS